MKRVWIVGLFALSLQGCVWWGDYKELDAKHTHLLEVKEQWEAEQSALSATVEDTRRAYQQLTVDQSRMHSQVESTSQLVRSAKADLQMVGTKVEGQGALLKEQQRQMGALADQFSHVMSQVATLADTNHLLANRVEQLTRVAKHVAMRITEEKKLANVSTKRSAPPVERAEAEGPSVKEQAVEGLNKEVASGVPTTPASGSAISESAAVNPVSLVTPPSSVSREPGTGTRAAVVNERAAPPVSGLPATAGAAVVPTSEATAPTGRWEQMKQLLRKVRPVQKNGSEALVPTARSMPGSAADSSHAGEAMAAAVPDTHRLSTISVFPGTPAPGAVMPPPQAPKP